jgi:hypothetical protein
MQAASVLLYNRFCDLLVSPRDAVRSFSFLGLAALRVANFLPEE